ncbi:MAG: hypothetical protein F6J94_24470 [Moorea sp. SIO1F2]|nr:MULTISPECIES: hypothetical protein [unclassified Moorena]NEO00085.1 hypothetical protein [Moorena sp. SIO3I7]NEO04887.1 hypothetical protein [Moorena sp. SIO3I8]NEO21501.1 hypothetical protein [Moorena sp. SIO4A5]NEP26571.1 hypothetical protein [Moorena sp. SIO3I6]NEQ59121.1 hypothetical protein [Moorena sp. SIO4A1]
MTTINDNGARSQTYVGATTMTETQVQQRLHQEKEILLIDARSASAFEAI